MSIITSYENDMEININSNPNNIIDNKELTTGAVSTDSVVSTTGTAQSDETRNPQFLSQIKQDTKNLYEAVKKVDFNLLGNGSTEFDKMLASMKNLNDYANDELNAGANGVVDAEKLATFFDKQKEALDSIRVYIDHKKEDLSVEAGHKSSWLRHRYEQPRINTAIDVLGKIETSYACGINAIVTNMRQVYRPNLSRRLADEEKSRSGDHTTVEAYVNSVARSIEMITKLDGSLWSLATGENPESLADYVRRVKAYAKKTNIQDAADLIKNNAEKPGHGICEKARNGEKFNNADIKTKLINEELPHYVEAADMKNYRPDAKIQQVKTEIASLKSEMLYANTKEQINKKSAGPLKK